MGGKRVFELILEIGSISKPLSKKLPNGYTHKWTVFVRGANNSKIEHCIQRVVFQLHHSFDNPSRAISEPPFQVKETGYAGFEIPIEIHFRNREKPNILTFNLDLCLLTNKPNEAKITEKIKFINPTKEFEKCLVKSGAQLLTVPVEKKRSDSPPAKKHKSSSLIPSKDMAKQSQQSSHHPKQQTSPQSQFHHSSTSSSSHQHHSSSNGIGAGSASGSHLHHQTTLSTTSKQQPKSSSREFIDVFGAPLMVNGNGKEISSSKSESNHNKHESSKKEHHRDHHNHHHNHHHHNQKSQQHLDRKHERQAEKSREQSHQKHDHNHHNDHHHSNHNHKQEAKHHNHNHVDMGQDNVKIEIDTEPQQSQTQFNNQSYVDDLQLIRTKISCLTDCDRLQKIVDIVEEAGEWYNLTSKKFEFDLKRLDKKTLNRIERCLH